jgi:group I intron endonuclease
MDNNLTRDDKDKVGLYIVRNKTTKEFYLGSGRLVQRLKYHERELTNNRHINHKLQKSFNKNPDMEFVATIIDLEGLTVEDNRKLALGSEQVFIDKFKDSSLLLNLAMKVDNPTFGTNLSADHKEKISKGVKERWSNMSDEEKKSHSEKISKAQNEHWSKIPKEEKEARIETLRHANIGVPLSDKRKKEVSDFFRGKNLTSSHKEKIGNALKGKPKNPDAVKNAVNARKEKGSYGPNENQMRLCGQPVTVDGEFFVSVSACAKAKNVSRQTVINRVRNNNFPGWAQNS